MPVKLRPPMTNDLYQRVIWRLIYQRRRWRQLPKSHPAQATNNLTAEELEDELEALRLALEYWRLSLFEKRKPNDPDHDPHNPGQA